MSRISIILTLAAIAVGGCVEREWTLRTEPAGAVAYVSHVEIGRTPVTIDFTWYGEYDVIFRKEGYETLKTSVKLDPPWYEVPGVDFFSEVAPWTYNDRRETLHLLKKKKEPNEADLKSRAEQLRQENVSGERYLESPAYDQDQ